MYRAYTTLYSFSKHLVAIKTSKGGSIAHDTVEEAIEFAYSNLIDKQPRGTHDYRVVIKRDNFIVYVANVTGRDIVKAVEL